MPIGVTLMSCGFADVGIIRLFIHSILADAKVQAIYNSLSLIISLTNSLTISLIVSFRKIYGSQALR